MDDFHKFNNALQAALAAALAWGDGRLYTTTFVEADKVYLGGFSDPMRRQHHNCNACLSFLRRYGGLAVIHAQHGKKSIWEFLDQKHLGEFEMPCGRLLHAANGSLINGIFESSDPILGTPESGGWHHMWLANPRVHKRGALTARQLVARHRQDHETLSRALREIPKERFRQVALLMSDSRVLRGDKFRALAEKYSALAESKPTAMQLWHELATNPPGFASIKSSVLGALYDDLSKGYVIYECIIRFNAATDARAYQQPTAAPKAGNIARAEQLFEQLDLARSLHRRVMSFDEVRSRCAWTPGNAKNAAKPTGLFGHLKPGATPIAMPNGTINISLRGFMEKVSPHASNIWWAQLNAKPNFGFLTTAVYEDAHPLFAWGHNASWVRYYASEAAQFGVSAGARVLGILDLPSTWHQPTHPHGLLFVVEGAADTEVATVGAGIAAEGLNNDLREVRRTLVAHSATGALDSCVGQAAAGIIARGDDFKPFAVAAEMAGTSALYNIVSWD